MRCFPHIYIYIYIYMQKVLGTPESSTLSLSYLRIKGDQQLVTCNGHKLQVG
jgi:hypothetical protein